MHYDEYHDQLNPAAESRIADDQFRQLQPVLRKRRRPDALPAVPARNSAREQGDDDESLPLWMMKITQPALIAMMDYLLSREPESAGMLLGPADDDQLITHFVPDRTGRGTSASFELGTDELNAVLKRMKPAGINCKGISHTHPLGVPSPSQGDLNYLRRVFGLPTNTEAAQFYLPIVCGGRLYPYVYAQGRVWHADLLVI
jgi:proteasome lid subunit RPN8/RPN11